MNLDDLQKRIQASLNYDPEKNLISIEREDLQAILEVLDEYETLAPNEEEE